MVLGAPQREEALVLRSIKLGETSKIVTVLTERYGRVKVVAKGARRVGSRLGSLLEPGNELEIVVYVREGRDLWTLSDASLRRAALTGARSIDKLSHLLAALELIDRVVPEQQAAPELAELYRSFLDRWHLATATQMPGLFFALELELATRLGVELDVRRCGACGADLTATPRAVHDAREGTLACGDCGGGVDGRWLDEATLRTLSSLRDVLSDGPPVELTADERSAIGRLMHDHLTYHLQGYRIPRSLYWLAPQDPDR